MKYEMYYLLLAQSRKKMRRENLQLEIKWRVCYKAMQNVLL